MNGKNVLSYVMFAALAIPVAAGAGTVTADRVLADQVLVREIGMRPPKAPDALYYSFDSDQGGSVTDDSGNGHDGTVYGSVWSSTGPYAGGAMGFNYDGACVEVGTAPDFPSWDAYSVSVWFLHDGGGYMDPSQYGHQMIDKTDWYHDWHLYLWPFGGSVGVGMYENGVGVGMGDGSINYMDNAWHHCVVIKNGNLGEFWIDGALKSTCDVLFPVYNSMTLCVGNSRVSNWYWAHSWSGKIDEIHIFDRAISSNEVARLYTEGSLPVTNVSASAVSVSTNLTVCGGLTVTGLVSFAEGVHYALPLGDLSCGIYTNRP
jgi:hypothetical protein